MAAFSTTVSYSISSDNGFAWTSTYDLSFLNSIFQVGVKIKLVGDAVGSNITTAWETGIETYWNHQAFFSDGTRLYEIKLGVDFVSSAQHQIVTVHNATGRDNMTNWYTDPQGWGPAYLDEIAAHEYGHMIGNYDEYSGGGTHNGYVTTGTLMSDLTIAGFQNYFTTIESYSETYSGQTLSLVLARKGTSAGESIAGTGGMDGIYGDAGDDTIRGFGGNDYIDGGSGTDSAVFSGSRSYYTLTDLGGGSVRVSGADDTDILFGVERLVFQDETVTWGPPLPVVTIGDHAVATNEWVRISDWLTYSGAPAVRYQLWDEGSAASSGYFWTPGNAHNPSGTAITVSAADLANTWVRGGQTGGAEAMWVRGFDGINWSDWEIFALTTLPNTVPVATINDHTVDADEWTQVAGWLTYSDANGNPATQYQFWDGNTNGNSGYFWTPDNAHQPAGVTITVSAAGVGDVWVRGGKSNGTDTMYVRAFDGTDWSDWDAFNLTTTGGNVPPVATITDHTVDANEWTQVLDWLSYSDANAATQYQFWDGNTNGNSGYFWTPDNAHQPAGVAITVSAANVGNVWVRGGISSGTDTMYVRAFDGIDWSDWDAFNLSTLGNTPPVATINDHTVDANAWTQVLDWLSYSDANGNAATQYQFWDGNTNGNSGYFWTPDNAHQPAGVAITVSAANVGNVWVRGGISSGTDTMYVRAFDGIDWSDWDAFNLTTRGNTPPVATISDHTVSRDQWTQVSTWLSYTDAEGHPATQYQFWDGNTNGNSGYFWTPDNAHQPAGVNITVSAANVGDVWVRGGVSSGTDTMYVRAFDGIDWSNWDQFALFTV